MTRSSFAACFLATAAALSSGLAYAGDYKPPGPAADFPSLDSYYPPAAWRAGQQGTATIHICVDAHGQLTEPPTLVESAGSEVLDTGAVNLANAGNGHYHPALQNGVPVAGCGGFRIAFKMRDSGAGLPVNDPRFPTIGARITKLDDELKRRIQARVNDPANPLVTAATMGAAGPGFERAIREYSRLSNDYIAEVVGMEADFLDDVDYLQESRDIPEKERKVFRKVWTDARQGLVLQIRETVGNVRDLVRVMDEMGDYMAFSVTRRMPQDTEQASVTPEDPQFTALKQRARAALEKLENATRSRSAGQ